MLFIGSCAAKFYALNKATGEEIWSYNIKQDGDQNSFHGGMLVTEKLVLIGTDGRIGHIYAFEKKSGAVRWKYRAPGSGAATDILRKSAKIYTVVDGDELHCLDLFTGKLHWSFKDSAYQDANLLFTQSAALAQGRVFFGANSGRVFALDADSGKLLWETVVSGRVSTSVLAANGEIFFGTGDGNLHRLSQETGEIESSFFTDISPVGRPTLTDDGFYVFLNSVRGAGRGEELVAVDLKLEKELWRKTSNAVWSATKSHVVNRWLLTGFEDNRIVGYDLTTGEQRWETIVRGEVRSMNSEGGILYVGTIAGMVYAVSLQ